ncbi:MAG: hypothetical protein WBV23_00215, partial [Desulfobaccales bacterium]
HDQRERRDVLPSPPKADSAMQSISAASAIPMIIEVFGKLSMLGLGLTSYSDAVGKGRKIRR